MRLVTLAAVGMGVPVAGQAPAVPVIRVIGHGVALTPPDVATIGFTVRGEGGTSDDAVRALVAKRTAIEAVLAGKAEVRTGKLSVVAARDKACDADDDDTPRLSTGTCAVKGYVAALRVTARVTAVAEAGTLLGLASRNGATDPSLESFDVAHLDVVQRAAVTDAVRDARAQAEVIAAAAGVRLGVVRRVEDQRAGETDGQDIVVTGMLARRVPVERSPVVVALSPEPVRTDATLIVEFAVGGAVP